MCVSSMFEYRVGLLWRRGMWPLAHPDPLPCWARLRACLLQLPLEQCPAMLGLCSLLPQASCLCAVLCVLCLALLEQAEGLLAATPSGVVSCHA